MFLVFSYKHSLLKVIILLHYASKKKKNILGYNKKRKGKKQVLYYFFPCSCLSPSSYTVCLLLKYKLGLKLFATPPLYSAVPSDRYTTRQNLYKPHVTTNTGSKDKSVLGRPFHNTQEIWMSTLFQKTSNLIYWLRIIYCNQTLS